MTRSVIFGGQSNKGVWIVPNPIALVLHVRSCQFAMAQTASAIDTDPEIYNYSPSIPGCTAVDRLASSQIQVGTFLH